MESTVIIPVATAIIGVITGAIPSYLGYKTKKMELEKSYQVTIEDRYYKNSREYVDVLYKPIYKILIEIEDLVNDISKSDLDFKHALSRIMLACDSIKNKDERIYIKENIEVEFLQMYWFIKSSLNCTGYTFGMRTKYSIFGISSSSYSEETFNDEKDVQRKIKILKVSNAISQLPPKSLFFSKSICSVDYEIMYKSANIKSKVFKKEISRYVWFLKQQIKRIALVNDLNSIL